MEEKKSKKPIIIGVAVTLLVTLTLLGVTYAYYRTRIIGNQNDTSISVTSKKLEIKYADDNAVIAPTEKISPGYSTSKQFTVQNTGDEDATYAIVFDNIETTFTRVGDWAYELYKGNEKITSGILTSDTTQFLYRSATTKSKVTDTYTVKLTYENSIDDQSTDMGATISLRVNITEEIMQTWESAEIGTLLYALKNNNTVKSPVTVPGQKIASSTEALLASTEDDFGTSYYFRGKVINNYVNYSGMCWRIVRVQGDGTIKIILADRDNLCEDSNDSVMDSNIDVGDMAIPYHPSTFSTVYEDFLYENSNTTAALDAWLNGGNFVAWDYHNSTDVIIDIDKQLDDSDLVMTDWCSDFSISGSVLLDSNYYEVTDDNDAVFTEEVFSGYARLVPTTTALPTLECNFTGVNGTSAKKYQSKIGMLTADEVVFAGSIFSTTVGSNDTSYLNDEGTEFWTMTPAYIDYKIADGSIDELRMFYYFPNNGFQSAFATFDGSVRPVVVLSSNVTIVDGGTGTQTNPYVVE